MAGGGQQALEIYQKHRDTIGVVLLDVQILDGPRILAALRKINPQVACCFMSGDTGNYTIKDLHAMGAVHVFSKPFGDPERLKQLLLEVIRKS